MSRVALVVRLHNVYPRFVRLRISIFVVGDLMTQTRLKTVDVN